MCRCSRVPQVRPSPPTSNIYLFVLVNWELLVGIPLSLLLEAAFDSLFSPPTSLQVQLESCVSVIFSIPAEAFGDPSSGALGSDLARLSVHLALSPAKIIHIIQANINNCIST